MATSVQPIETTPLTAALAPATQCSAVGQLRQKVYQNWSSADTEKNHNHMSLWFLLIASKPSSNLNWNPGPGNLNIFSGSVATCANTQFLLLYQCWYKWWSMSTSARHHFISEYSSTDALVVITKGNMTKELDIRWNDYFRENYFSTCSLFLTVYSQCFPLRLSKQKQWVWRSGVWGVGYLMFPTTAYENLIVDSQRISLLVPLNTRG